VPVPVARIVLMWVRVHRAVLMYVGMRVLLKKPAAAASIHSKNNEHRTHGCLKSQENLIRNAQRECQNNRSYGQYH